MCFDVANKMNWTTIASNYFSESNTSKLTHIGFGLVCGKDGSKLKTRSGDTVKMLDVIDEVVQLSEKVIKDRSKNLEKSDEKCNKKCNEKKYDLVTMHYQNIDEFMIKDMSRKIGINTLKYFDLSHTFLSNYKYDPELMFRFNGDTGVYLMYCFARINGIIEKSSYKINRLKMSSLLSELIDQGKIDYSKIVYTKETRDLMIHIINFSTVLKIAISDLNTNILTKYVYNLCMQFNSYITQKNGKIIGSNTEAFGIIMCLITSKIIELIFDILSFDKVDHI